MHQEQAEMSFPQFAVGEQPQASRRLTPPSLPVYQQEGPPVAPAPGFFLVKADFHANLDCKNTTRTSDHLKMYLW